MSVPLALVLAWLVLPLPLGLLVGACLRWGRDGGPPAASPDTRALLRAALADAA